MCLLHFTCSLYPLLSEMFWQLGSLTGMFTVYKCPPKKQWHWRVPDRWSPISVISKSSDDCHVMDIGWHNPWLWDFQSNWVLWLWLFNLTSRSRAKTEKVAQIQCWSLLVVKHNQTQIPGKIKIHFEIQMIYLSIMLGEVLIYWEDRLTASNTNSYQIGSGLKCFIGAPTSRGLTKTARSYGWPASGPMPWRGSIATRPWARCGAMKMTFTAWWLLPPSQPSTRPMGSTTAGSTVYSYHTITLSSHQIDKMSANSWDLVCSKSFFRLIFDSSWLLLVTTSDHGLFMQYFVWFKSPILFYT